MIQGCQSLFWEGEQRLRAGRGLTVRQGAWRTRSYLVLAQVPVLLSVARCRELSGLGDEVLAFVLPVG